MTCVVDCHALESALVAVLDEHRGGSLGGLSRQEHVVAVVLLTQNEADGLMGLSPES